MNVEKYPVIIGESSMVFEFVSKGIRGSIPKLIIYSKIYFPNFYNLGFGDKDELTGEIDDEIVTNNGDQAKVLATVASTIYSFIDKFSEAIIFASGSTKSRTRL